MDDAQSLKTPVTIYCDLSKAFDCLNFDIFLSKMEWSLRNSTCISKELSY